VGMPPASINKNRRISAGSLLRRGTLVERTARFKSVLACLDADTVPNG
jgi:hypothetical protein